MELAQVASDAGLGVKQLGTILGWTAAVIFGSGLLILLFRVTLEGTPKNQRRDISSVVDTTTIRSWLAISLISGLLIFGAASFVLDGASELRNLLMGGIIASAGTATAFYFASKTSEQTQQNLLNAAFGAAGPIKLPKVAGMTVGNARTVLQALGLTLQTDPADAADERVIKATDPTADSPAKLGDKITATLEPVVVDAAAVDFPVPNLVGMTVGEGRTVLQALGLTLQTDPADAADERVIKATDPTADSPAKAGDKITVTLADE